MAFRIRQIIRGIELPPPESPLQNFNHLPKGGIKPRLKMITLVFWYSATKATAFVQTITFVLVQVQKRLATPSTPRIQACETITK